MNGASRLLRIGNAMASAIAIFSLSLLVPVVFAFAYDAGQGIPSTVGWYAATALAMALLWAPVKILARRRGERNSDVRDRESYVALAIGWLIVAALSMIPFLFAGMHPVDAFFESMSGLTTTSSSLLVSAPVSLIIWRATLQYLGGMGIIVLAVTIMARLTSGLQVMPHTAGHATRLRPRVIQTARLLWTTYLGLSAVLFIVMLVGRLVQDAGYKQAILDATLVTMGTVSTGGFMVPANGWLQGVVLLFMLVAGMNFTLVHNGLRGDARMLKDTEWRLYVLLFLAGTVVVGALAYTDAGVAGLAASAMTVGAIVSTTGGVALPESTTARIVLILLMVVGGSVASTAGGLKVVRLVMLYQIVWRQTRRLLHPRSVIPIRLDGRALKEETLLTGVAFFFSYVTILAAGAAFVAATDPAYATVFEAVAAAASMIGNIGFAGDVEGRLSTKIVFSILMWVGRLELFVAMLLFNRDTWKA